MHSRESSSMVVIKNRRIRSSKGELQRHLYLARAADRVLHITDIVWRAIECRKRLLGGGGWVIAAVLCGLRVRNIEAGCVGEVEHVECVAQGIAIPRPYFLDKGYIGTFLR